MATNECTTRIVWGKDVGELLKPFNLGLEKHLKKPAVNHKNIGVARGQKLHPSA